MITYGKVKEKFQKRDYLGLTLPIAMYILGCSSIILTLTWWLFILIVASFVLGWIGFNKKIACKEEDIKLVLLKYVN